MDCPEDVNTYIHRVGRTARYKSKGNSLLFLTQSEQKFVDQLQKKNVPLKQLKANPQRALTITPTLQSLLVEHKELMHLAQKAFTSYMRSVYLMPNKEVFDVKKVDSVGFASSLGLETQPEINFKESAGESKTNLNKFKDKIARKKLEKLLLEQERTSNLDKSSLLDVGDKDQEMEEEELFIPKKKLTSEVEEEEEEFTPQLTVSKKKLKKIKAGGIFGGKNKIFFGSEGKPISAEEFSSSKNKALLNEAEKEDEDESQFIERIQRKLRINNEEDKKQEKDRIKIKHLKKRLRNREVEREEGEEEAQFKQEDNDDGEDEEDDQEIQPKASKKTDEEKTKKEKLLKRKKFEESEDNLEDKVLSLIKSSAF